MKEPEVVDRDFRFMGNVIRDDLMNMTASAFALLEDSLVLYLQNYPNKDTSTWIEDACVCIE